MKRELFGIEIRVDENNNFLSLSDLQAAFDSARKVYGWSKRGIHTVLDVYNVRISIFDQLKSRGLVSYNIDTFNSEVINVGMGRYLKSLGLYITKGARKTKRVFCCDWLWKIIYFNMFKDSTLVGTPSFISDINCSLTLIGIQNSRSRSMENIFIDNFISSSSLISSNPKKQFNLSGYKYDLYIKIMDTPFLIEYHEKQHANEENFKNDYKKFLECYNRDFAYLAIPYNKEADQMEYLKRAIKKGLSIEDINEVEEVRFKSILSGIENSDMIINEINKRCLGDESTYARNMASSFELIDIINMEYFIKKNIENGNLKRNSDIINVINKVK